ncbi:putative beta-1 [Abeliophyllum distichum]|uniref:Beta-1 n=1 Tax=Abeliophyllum distichum TaxID=126358 RepID=A0ABD1Q4X9_9LAMI
MKKWTGGVVIISLGLLLVVSYSFIGKSESPKKQSAYEFFNNHPSGDDNSDDNADVSDERSKKKMERLGTVMKKPQFMDFEGLSDLYSLSSNWSKEESNALLVWNQMRFLLSRSDALPETSQGIKEAAIVWKDLLKDKASKLGDVRESFDCPYFVIASNTTMSLNGSVLDIPCGLVVDSSITVIGIPGSWQDSFQIELIGSQLPEEPNPPIVLQYKVFLPGENLTKEPVSILNTWTKESGWGKEVKCPHHGSTNVLNVDGLVNCNTQIFGSTTDNNLNASHSGYFKSSNVSEGSRHASSNFHFVDGNPFTATLWAGDEGFHMTVNGRHETSFAYREKLEPWLVSRVDVKGGLDVVSILAKGLPVSKDLDLVADAQHLKAPSLSNKRPVLLIGVFSTGNNFERRMALRRSWMQYDTVRSGEVAVHFFIGLHKNKEVNFQLWKEAQAYGDIQLMPFVDYYNLLTYKTVAICILGTKILQAKYIMKTDDDAFVRIDEVLSSLRGKASSGLLYGHISFESEPHRNKDNKWYISNEEWAHSSYPPWAHGPGYIISQDIAKFIVQGHQERELMLFKLEDVAVGIWIERFEKHGHKVDYVNDERFYIAGCESNYVLAHYQNPRMMLCMWEKLQKVHKPECCE